MGWSLWKKASPHFPLSGKASCWSRANGYWKTWGKVSISANFASLFLPNASSASQRVRYYRNTRVRPAR